MQTKHENGQDIDSYCGKCGKSTAHTIAKMVDETVSKVRCRTCGSMHKFRRPLASGAVRKPRVKRGAGNAATTAMVWEAGMEEATGKARAYRMDAQYRVGDVVDHPTFGRGVVLRLHVNKCGMLFKDGEKLMASTNQ